jgi:hypothetical protein
MYNYIYNLEKKWNNSSISSLSNINELSDIENNKFTMLNYNNDEFIVYSSQNNKNQKITIGYSQNVVCVVFLLDFLNKCGHLQLLDKFTKNQTSEDINKMVLFCIDFAKKRGMKCITLEDRASLICKKNGQKYTAKLSDYYLLKKYNSYYGHKFGFILENKTDQRIFLEDVNKLRSTKIKDIDWEKIIIKIQNDNEFKKWSKLFNKIDKNNLLNTLFEEMEDKFFSILDLLIINVMKQLNISTLRGQIFIKNF